MAEEDIKRLEELYTQTESNFHREHTRLKCMADEVINYTKLSIDSNVVNAGQIVWKCIYVEINNLIELRITRRNKWFELKNQHVAKKKV